MRCEWSTTKGEMLFIGSTGTPWVNPDGSVANRNPMWIKTISPLGVIRNIDWSGPYEKMKAALGIGDKGYIIHECALWSSRMTRWYFIPRHVSNTPYRPGDERKHGSTIIFAADASFSKILVVDLEGTSANPRRGVTDCKFVPNGRDQEIMVTKIEEMDSGVFQSFIAIYSVDGKQLLDDTPMPRGWKFEGLELRPLIHHEK
jgi:soluble calcium-activated nucleotidase 1